MSKLKEYLQENKISIQELIENKIQLKIKENTLKVMEDAKQDIIPVYLDKKIKNESHKKGYSYQDILNLIKINEMYASFFAKDPIKQNLAENIQLEVLQNITNVKKLIQHGKKSIRLYDGDIITKSNKVSTKSLDFYDEDNETYYYCKYTKDEGGAQDNQFRDVVIFIQECNKYCEKNNNSVKFIALLNGNYYNEKKINLLNSLIIYKERIIIENNI